jgi:adenine-specific DNA-methyltransferase
VPPSNLPSVSRPKDTEDLASLPRLLGAAVALGAEGVPTVSEAERDACRNIDLISPRAVETKVLRDLILNGFDPLGDAFCRMRSPEIRRADGATYTSGPIVEAMVAWSRQGPTVERIIDPGSGSARFAVAAGLSWPKAHVVAVELDPVAALLSRANLAVRGMADRACVVVADYRAFEPGSSPGSRTLYIGNPPYIRHHKIPAEWKAWLARTAGSRGLGASQLAGSHVHFFLATVHHAQSGDRGVFITSSEWLDVNYGSLVRELVLDGLGGSAIHVIAPEARPFDDAQTTAAITCFEIGNKPKSVRLRRVKTVKDLGTLQGGQAVRHERLAEARRWTPLLRAARKVPDGHVELGEICRVHRGAATGANRIWVVDPRVSDLPEHVLVRSVTRARELFAAGTALATTEALRAVVDLPADLDELEDSDDRRAIERFLKTAKRLGVHKGYLARTRRAWWSVGLRQPAPILATYMARRPPAFVRNLAGARHINIAHGLYPREPLSDAALDGIATALRTTINVGQGRTYAGGLTKFEPREMEGVLIPNPDCA